MFNRLITLPANHPIKSLFVAMMMTVVAVTGLAKLEFNDDYDSFFKSNTDRYADFEAMKQGFGNDNNVCSILLEAENLLQIDSLNTLRNVHEAVQNVENVKRVFSLYSLRSDKKFRSYLRPLIPGGDLKPNQLPEIAKKIKMHPFGLGKLLSEDAKATLVFVELDDVGDGLDEIKSCVESIQETVQSTTEGSPLAAAVTGTPAIRVEVVRNVRRDQLIFAAAGVSLASLVAWFLFGRISTLIVVLLPSILGVTWTLGLMGLLGQSLNVVNVVLTPLLLVIGFTDSVHLMFCIGKLRSDTLTTKTTSVESVLRIAPACVLTSITTSIGFASLAVSGDEIIKEFGFFAAIGVLLTLMGIITVVPSLASLGFGLFRAPSRDSRWNFTNWMCRRVPGFVMKHSRATVSVALVLVVILSYFSVTLKPDFRYSENLPTQSSAAQTLARCDELFGGSSPLQVVIRWPDNIRVGNAELHTVVDEVERAVTENHIAVGATSLNTLLKSLPQSKRNRLPIRELRNVPAEALKQWVNFENKKTLVVAKVPDIGSAQLRPELDAIEKKLEAIETSHPGFELALTGTTVLSTYRSQPMIRELIVSLVVAGIVIFIVLSVFLKSLRFGLISVIPNILPMLASLGILKMTGSPIQYVSAMSLTVCLGIAVDDTIHFLMAFRRELTDERHPRRAARRAMREIGPVLLYTTVLLIAGFGVTLFSAVPTIQVFGGLACLALFWALLGDLIFLPALVVVLYPRQRKARVSLIKKAKKGTDSICIPTPALEIA